MATRCWALRRRRRLPPPLITAPPPPSPLCARQAGAIAAFLRELLLLDLPYAAGLQADMAACLEVHFRDMAAVMHASGGGGGGGGEDRKAHV